MLDGLLKSKYHTKCKTLLRMIKTRLEALKKKKCSVVKFLKNDIADLLKNGLDANAYGRAQGLLAEQKIVTCYNLMEQFCDLAYNNVNNMAKERECPEDCKEAVQSLLYAAARISEIPELRDLRKVFIERYESTLELYTNKQFVETFMPVSATKEMKLELLNEISAEFNLNWNSKSLENELSEVSEKHGSLKNKENDKKGHLYTERIKAKTNGIEEAHILPHSSQDDMTSSRRGDSIDVATSSSVGNSSDNEVDSRRPFSDKSIPPPYVKAVASKVESNTLRSPKNVDLAEECKPKSVRRSRADERPSQPLPGSERSMDDKAKSWNTSNESSDIRKSEQDGMPERLIDEEAGKSMKMHSLTLSEQPRPQCIHAHPKLPDDFDDLAARLAALRGR